MHSVGHKTAEERFHPRISAHQPSYRIRDLDGRSQFDHARANNRGKLSSWRDRLDVDQVVVPNCSFESDFDRSLEVLIVSAISRSAISSYSLLFLR